MHKYISTLVFKTLEKNLHLKGNNKQHVQFTLSKAKNQPVLQAPGLVD